MSYSIYSKMEIHPFKIQEQLFLKMYNVINTYTMDKKEKLKNFDKIFKYIEMSLVEGNDSNDVQINLIRFVNQLCNNLYYKGDIDSREKEFILYYLKTMANVWNELYMRRHQPPFLFDKYK